MWHAPVNFYQNRRIPNDGNYFFVHVKHAEAFLAQVLSLKPFNFNGAIIVTASDET